MYFFSYGEYINIKTISIILGLYINTISKGYKKSKDAAKIIKKEMKTKQSDQWKIV